MKKAFSRPVSALLMLPLAVFLLSCCCFVLPAQAAVPAVSKKAMPCHQASSDASKPQNNQQECCKKNSALGEGTSYHQISKVHFIQYSLAPVQLTVVSHESLNHFSTHSPPPKDSIPLYLKNSILRI